MTAVLFMTGCTAANVRPQSAAAAPYDRGCVTGSRIPNNKSCAAFGHVYTSEDIQHTGATTAADALRLLDPSITVSR